MNRFTRRPTRKKIREDIARYVEPFYNRHRIHSVLGYRGIGRESAASTGFNSSQHKRTQISSPENVGRPRVPERHRQRIRGFHLRPPVGISTSLIAQQYLNRKSTVLRPHLQTILSEGEHPMGDIRELAHGFSFLEGPRWHDGRLFVSDFYAHRVLAIDESGAVEVIAEVQQQPSGLGWLPDGRLLIASMLDRKILRKETNGVLAEHADLNSLTTWHLNDMVVDACGRAYVGHFGFDLMSGAPVRTASIVIVEPDGSARVGADGLLFPNGMALLDGGSTLIVAESFGNKITAYDVSASGALTNRKTWAAFGPQPTGTDFTQVVNSATVVPDGLSVPDDGGMVWVADAIGHRVLRVAEGGEIVDELSTGDLQVFACALGGSDGRTLFMCAAPSFAEHERRDTRDAVLLAAAV